MNQLVLCTLLLLVPGELARACPAGCQCQDPKTILCAARRGHTVPRGLPPNTLSLYVFENGITMLSEDSFAGLPALQLLDLSQNKIASIQKNIFQPLTELVNLDLSSNQLQEITNETSPGSSAPVSFSVPPAPSSPPPQICPPRTCLNGGTCQLDARSHLQCLCPQGFAGAYCEEEEEVKGTTPSPGTQAPPPSRRISITQVSSTSLKVDLQNYIQSKAQLKGIRLSYRNLSGPDKRPVMLRLPASLAEYTVRALRPNCTYRVCVGPLGEKVSKEEFCVEAHTLQLTHQQHSPVTQGKDNNLTLMIVPALAAVLLLVVVVTGVTYYRRHRRAKAHAGGGVDAGPLELEGVKACLDNGDLGTHSRKGPEPAMLSGGSECEVPLMQAHYPSNNNTTALKPSYF